MFKCSFSLNNRQIWLDSMIGMSIGFFATLIVGSIIGLFGKLLNFEFLKDIAKVLSYLVGFAIGIGVGIKSKLTNLQVFALGIASMLASISLFAPIYQFSSKTITLSKLEYGFNVSKFKPGDVFGAWIVAIIGVYFFKSLLFQTFFDIFLVPLIGILLGLFASCSIIFVTGGLVAVAELIVAKIATIEKVYLKIILAPIIGFIMGLALTLPTSSAAMAFVINLHGFGANIAMAATSAQMISFAVLTYFANKSFGKSLAVGVGTSMLHIHNYFKSPRILIIPAICSMFSALISVSLSLTFPTHPTVTAGMGTSGLYGPIFTLVDNGLDNYLAWIHVLLMQILLPMVLATGLWFLFLKMNWITPKELILEHV